LPVGGAKDQHLDELVEDDAVGDAGAMADQGVSRFRREKCRELAPERLDEE
jgi:hypothetical protein